MTYFLEMTDLNELRPAVVFLGELKIEKLKTASTEFNKEMYIKVGKKWQWTDRLAWSEGEWKKYVERPELSTWAAFVSGEIAGYFELEKQENNGVEIAYFGLLPKFIGRGIGGNLLTEAIRSAWEVGASRVWVHTCSLDHPNALKNYLARGFKIYRTVKENL